MTGATDRGKNLPQTGSNARRLGFRFEIRVRISVGVRFRHAVSLYHLRYRGVRETEWYDGYERKPTMRSFICE